MKRLAGFFWLLTASATALVLPHVLVESASAQNIMDQMILQRCSSAMQSDFDKAGQTPAPGLIEKTCSCVVKQINATHNIDLAKSLCTPQSTSGS